jgi:DNA invertase Pin-like site-specific DNA recombinase
MTKAVLYARVRSDAQQKEGTIESQVVELKRQIAAAGHVLVREYIDDGITGTVLDRPALEQLRQDAKSDLFERINFHAADRTTREAAHQTIIIGELLRLAPATRLHASRFLANRTSTSASSGMFSKKVNCTPGARPRVSPRR